MKVLTTIRGVLGWCANLLCIPAPIRPGPYRSHDPNTRLDIRTGKHFTIITVHGIGFYFSRLGGRLLAVGCGVDPEARSIDELE
jgi:hypothetical protein